MFGCTLSLSYSYKQKTRGERVRNKTLNVILIVFISLSKCMLKDGCYPINESLYYRKSLYGFLIIVNDEINKIA